MRRTIGIIVFLGAAMAASGACTAAGAGPERRPELRNSPREISVSLVETLAPSPIVDLSRTEGVTIAGRVYDPSVDRVRLRATTSLGETSEAAVAVSGGALCARYPADFAGACPLAPCVLFIDATTDDSFDVSRSDRPQAEAAVLVVDSATRRMADLPSAFFGDLRDVRGRVDRESSEWPVVRTLVNLYMRSQAAEYCGVGRTDFDLDRTEDLAWFKDHLSLFEFDHRDRDWSTPLGQRVAGTFWQSVWDTWFNAGNNNPIDGNPANASPDNYVPYAFANDYADILIAWLLRLDGDTQPLDDNLPVICREGMENLLAMQHTTADNFAVPGHDGRRETYTAGAFRYGMFENGTFMTERTGWFYNPKFKDYARGGVLNGRCVWGLGEAIGRGSALGSGADQRLHQALALAIKFCLHGARPLGYARQTAAGNVYWRDPGEHAYLALGLVAACRAVPDLPVPSPSTGEPVPLRAVAAESLDALVDLAEPHGQWLVYPNVDSVAIAALAEGADVLADHGDAARWQAAAVHAADAWLASAVDSAEGPSPPVHFGLRIAPERMTFNWRHLSPACANYNAIYFYQTGHWMHALARLYALTGDTRYRDRATAMLRYLCGDNPWQVRLFNELGGVYNWVDDMDGDGVEDRLRQDMYPESTAFCQIGVVHLLRATADRDR